MYVLDAIIQPRPYKGIASECFTVGAQSFTYRINRSHHCAPPCAVISAGPRALTDP